MRDDNFIKFDKETMRLNIGDIIEGDFLHTTITQINFGIICVDNGFSSTQVKIDKIKSVYPIQDQRFDNMTETLCALGLERGYAKEFVLDMLGFVKHEIINIL